MSVNQLKAYYNKELPWLVATKKSDYYRSMPIAHKWLVRVLRVVPFRAMVVLLRSAYGPLLKGQNHIFFKLALLMEHVRSPDFSNFSKSKELGKKSFQLTGQGNGNADSKDQQKFHLKFRFGLF